MPDGARGQNEPPKSTQRLLPNSRMGYLMLFGIIIWFVNWTFSADDTLFGSHWLKAVADFLSFLALIPLVWFLYRGFRWMVTNLLWRLRRRLIVTYLLIGALPLLLVTALVVLIGYAIIWQGTSSLVARLLDGYLNQSKAAAIDLRNSIANDAHGSDELQRRLRERHNVLSPIFPDLRLSLYSSSFVTMASLPDSATRSGPLPLWLRDSPEFHGLVVVTQPDKSREVRAYHMVRTAGSSSSILELSYPIGTKLTENLSRITGFSVRPGQTVLRALAGDPTLDTGTRVGGSPQIRGGTLSGLVIIVPLREWETGGLIESDALTIDPSFLRPGHIWQRVTQFGSRSVMGSILITLIASFAIFFLLIAMLAIISAIFLTRSITGTVHNLYRGTLRVESGDLTHEIPIRGNDQLSGLAISFNQMTRSIRELLRVSAEKQRLDEEMRIANEVQTRLFPRKIPQSQNLDIAPGVCIPARTVSGDYFDFVEAETGVLGIVVADVCGKGVSAALMMANLQANLRSQIVAFHDTVGDRVLRSAPLSSGPLIEAPRSAGSGRNIGRILERVNRLVAGSMLEANYITLFYAEFDEVTSRLSYVNAGHNPPLVVRNGSDVETLEKGGTVLGLFRDVVYDVGELKMDIGDLLVAFTDGLVEARNANGDELGQDRLTELVRKFAHLSAAEIEQSILRSVREWTGGAEQEDDLTLVVIKDVGTGVTIGI